MCGILSAYAFSMTIPSRPAPPPPQSKNISSRIATQPIYNNNYSLSSDTSRYTPTTNWDDVAFDNYVQINDIHQQQQQQQQKQQEQHQQSLNIIKKIPPPRPPPPKISIKSLPPLKKPNQPTSINILSNLFGTSSQSSLSTSSSFTSSSSSSYRSRTPTKLQNFNQTTTSNKSSLYQTFPPPTKIQQQTTELISFDSPPSSPTLTQKSNSDCVSIGSCSSDSNNYSPSNNGHVSQAESGFEDDFTLESQKLGTTVSSSSFAYVQNQKQQQIKDPFDLIDPFEMKPEIKTKPIISQKPLIIGNNGTSFYTHNSNYNYNNNNNNNGSKNVLSTSKVTVQAAQQMPTIIKPVIKTPKPKLDTISSINNNVSNINSNNNLMDRSSYTSLPMPNCPPPPPPPLTQSAQLENITNVNEQQQTTDNNESYGFALYDFDAIEEGDLSLRKNEKVYIFKKLNDEWLYGKNRRGCEGMFPINYIDIKVPLNVNVVNDNTTTNNNNNNNNNTTTTTTNNSLIKAVAETTTTDKSNATMKSLPIVKALYNFNAELPSDLTIYENDMITILYQINSDWLYGQIGTRQGQFPSNFIEYIPSNLPFKTS